MEFSLSNADSTVIFLVLSSSTIGSRNGTLTSTVVAGVTGAPSGNWHVLNVSIDAHDGVLVIEGPRCVDDLHVQATIVSRLSFVAVASSL